MVQPPLDIVVAYFDHIEQKDEFPFREALREKLFGGKRRPVAKLVS